MWVGDLHVEASLYSWLTEYLCGCGGETRLHVKSCLYSTDKKTYMYYYTSDGIVLQKCCVCVCLTGRLVLSGIVAEGVRVFCAWLLKNMFCAVKFSWRWYGSICARLLFCGYEFCRRWCETAVKVTGVGLCVRVCPVMMAGLSVWKTDVVFWMQFIDVHVGQAVLPVCLQIFGCNSFCVLIDMFVKEWCLLCLSWSECGSWFLAWFGQLRWYEK